MPSGNKVIGHIYNQHQHMNIEIYISSKIRTEGLCGSFDGNRDNDLFNRFNNQTKGTIVNKLIDVNTSASWRLNHLMLSVVIY